MKDIYEMFNDIEVDENEFEEMAVSEIEKERIKKAINEAAKQKKIKRKKRFTGKKKAAIAAAITLICISSALVVKPALANNIPIIGELFKKDLISINEEYANYINVIGKTKSCKGIDVTFESAAVDNNVLFLSIIVKNNNYEIKDKWKFTDALAIPGELKVNGEQIAESSGVSLEFIDNNTIRVLKMIQWPSGNMTNKMNIEMNTSKLFGKSGDWGIKFSLDKSKQAEKTSEEKVNAKLEINGMSGEISTVTVSPLTVALKAEGDFRKLSNAGIVGFIALDDKGNLLRYKGSAGSGPKVSPIYISNKDMKALTIIPYFINASKAPDKLPPVNLDVKNVKPIELISDQYRSIVIKDYFIEGDYLVVRYSQKNFGKDGFPQIFGAGIYLTVEGVQVKDATDDKARELNERYNDQKDVTIVYKVGASRNFMVGTLEGSNVKILKDQSVTVNLNK